MTTNLIDEAASVFHSLERWTAFYEIERQVSSIVIHWLTKGAEGLRKDFEDNPSPLWKCSKWGLPRDTRWYLSDLGERSIGIGIGWSEFELYLFHGGCDPQIREQALQILESSTFEPLRILAGSPEYRSDRKRDGCILSDQAFNPVDEVGDPILRQRIIAWHAVNRTSMFVQKVSARIRQITENPNVVRLIEELNQRCVVKPVCATE